MRFRFKYYFLVLFFSFSTAVLFAQDEDGKDDTDDDDNTTSKHKLSEDGKKNYYVFSPRLNVTVPHPTANSSFHKCFVGVYEVSGGLNIMLYKGLFIGATAKDGLLRITENKIANYEASMEIDNLAGKIGSDFYLGDRNRLIFSAAMSIGQNKTQYYGLVAKDPHKIITNTSFTATYYEPEVDLYFLVEDNFGVGISLTYTVFNHVFDPYELSLDDWAGFDKPPISGNTQYVSFGFGFYYSFLRKKHQ